MHIVAGATPTGSEPPHPTHSTPPPPPAAASPRASLCVCAAPEAEAAPAAASKAEPSYGGSVENYAVVEIGGHQLIVEEGRWYTVNRLEVGVGT